MSGLKGSLDDAYEHTDKARQALVECAGLAARDGVLRDVADIHDLIDAAASRISNLANQLRS